MSALQTASARAPQRLADRLWILRYPQSVLGLQLGRNVTIIQLQNSALLIHSTAPFTPEDVAAINKLGEPRWLIDATLFHDTFSAHGRSAFPLLPYYTPEGFSEKSGSTLPLRNPPREWRDELEILPIEGVPKLNEYALFHRPTRTIVLADLLFNFAPESGSWTNFFFKHMNGIRQFPGMSRLFRASIKDRAAFKNSIDHLLGWDFDRAIVSHGNVINTGAKPLLTAALRFP